MKSFMKARRDRRAVEEAIGAAELAVLKQVGRYMDSWPHIKDDRDAYQALHAGLAHAENELRRLTLQRSRKVSVGHRAGDTPRDRTLRSVREYVNEVANPAPDYAYRAHCRDRMFAAAQELRIVA